jgi:ferric-dicitrate binding protein FerR (iron transport regulator)
MEPDDRTHRLLEEIRDAQRDHLAEYRRVTQQSLDLQQRAVDRQQELGRLYRRIVALGGGSIVVLMALLLYLLVRWSHDLFR